MRITDISVWFLIILQLCKNEIEEWIEETRDK